MSNSKPPTDRSNLTFEQAEGIEPLPTPLALKEISQELRAKVWSVVQPSLESDQTYDPTGYSGDSHITGKWETILKDHFVMVSHRYIDEFDSRHAVQVAAVKAIVQNGDHVKLLGFLQYVLRHTDCPYQFAGEVGWALRSGRAAYQIIDNGKTIVPISSEGEAKAVEKAFADLSQSEFGGAKAHLRKAGELLTEGKDADSIRESIHAVESVARLLDPQASSTLGPALQRLEKEGFVHPVLKQGFEKIYGYTNAQEGIRHAILEGSSNLDSTDAQFMFGACASFVSYLISKARKAKIDIK